MTEEETTIQTAEEAKKNLPQQEGVEAAPTEGAPEAPVEEVPTEVVA